MYELWAYFIEKKMSKILLINPCGAEMLHSGNAQPPIGFLYLAAELRKAGHSVIFVDGIIKGRKAVIEAIKKCPDVIGIQILTIKRHKALNVVRWAKQYSPESKIVLGGPHASTNKMQLLKHYPINDVCVGEGEKWLLNFVETGVGKQEIYKNLDELPFPAWDMIDLWDYMSHVRGEYGLKAHIMFSRSCPFACSFCSSWSIWGEYRVRSPQNMIEEMRYLYYHRNVTHIYFVDDITTYDREATIGLCEEILKDGMKIHFNFLTRADCVDPEMLKLLAKAGCYKISYGVESANHDVLKGIHKNDDIELYLQKCEQAVVETMKAGMATSVLMMIGNPGETNQSISESLQFLKKTRPTHLGCRGGVWILPRTALYQKAKREGYIDDDFWLKKKEIMCWPFPWYKLRFWKFRLSSYRWDFLIKHVIAYFIPRNIYGVWRRRLFLFIRKYWRI